MKILVLTCFIYLGMALALPPGVKPRLPPGVDPRSTCPALPSFMSAYDRIIGGQTATSPIPWQVSLRQCAHGSCHYCGGTVLDSKTILTAAHCKVQTSHYIMVGKVSKNEGQNVQVSKVINGNWNEQTMDNDIAILKLSTALTLGGDIQAICLPSAGFNPAKGATCFVSGWGTTKEGDTNLPTNLQYVGVPVVTNADCNSAYNNDITANMICAGFTAGGKDSCQGDSGGPFVCMENGNPVITGVVSFGAGCARPGLPGVYARVTQYLTWIKANMETSAPAPSPPSPSPPSPSPPSPPPSPPPATGCGNDAWKGDGFCDDGNNNAGCAYDGGDCCGTNVNTQYCTECKCKESTSPPPSPPSPPPSPPSPPPATGCGNEAWKGDGFCDDNNNNAGCAYDGGDCCGTNVNTTYCTECKCYQ